MHGLGNDYLYLYCDEVPKDVVDLAIKYSDRHFGVGSDGLIYILPSDVADFKMRIFNADGSEAKMCGNGIRCVGKYVYDRGYTDKTEVTVETLSGIKTLQLSVDDGRVASVSVEMGRAVVSHQLEVSVSCGLFYDEVTRSFCESRNDSEPIPVIPVDMGNPHAVIFCEDAEAAPVDIVGPAIEKSPAFPDGVNVEFVQQISSTELRMCVWERGSGITWACGTGSCASVAAAVAERLCKRGTDVTVHLDGGDLTVLLDADNNVVMTGPAAFVCDGKTIE